MIGMNKISYADLLMTYLPGPIKTEADYAATQAEVDRLVDQEDLSPAEQDYLDLLGTLIWAYEARTEEKTQYDLRGVALLKGLMELYDLKQKDLLPIFKTRSIVSAILRGKRRLTADHINQVATFFQLPHTLFFEPVNLTFHHADRVAA
jgi:HTH-type transcriptional regulator / antitoxin HigA